MDGYEYGYNLGRADGITAADWIKRGKPVDHGGLLGENDAYAIGYRHGMIIVKEDMMEGGKL